MDLRIYLEFSSVQQYSDVPGKSINLEWSLSGKQPHVVLRYLSK